MKTNHNVKTIDEYLATVSDEKSAAPEKLQKTINSIVPDAKGNAALRKRKK